MAVFCDAVQCSLVKTDASEKLAARIIMVINHPAWPLSTKICGATSQRAAIFIFVVKT
jgi:hypothetical protein